MDSSKTSVLSKKLDGEIVQEASCRFCAFPFRFVFYFLSFVFFLLLFLLPLFPSSSFFFVLFSSL